MKGRTSDEESDASNVTSNERSQPTLWASDEAEKVEPSKRVGERSDDTTRATSEPHPPKAERLVDQMLTKANLRRALQRVESNGGAPGPDGMTVGELRSFLGANWPDIAKRLAHGTYRPQPVRRVEIPKPGGGLRALGVPTVLDRYIQQAMLQVLTPVFDPHFSDASFGFRPKRSAHMAVERARSYIGEGLGIVVDIDLDSFFDRVNHDALMSRVFGRVDDEAMLKLIRAYLNAGVMVGGVKVGTTEGTPQGGPLSPLLANIMLDDLDRELERRGHRFVRYADDISIYVRSERAGQRVLDGVSSFIEHRLKLRVNRAKSAVAAATKRGLLGFSFFYRNGEVKVRIDPKAKKALKARIRKLTSRTWGTSMGKRISILNRFIRGWCAYFAFADTASVFDEFDEWLRRRLRQVRWKEWKRPATRAHNLRRLGIERQKSYEWGFSRKGSWRIAASPPLGRALP
ncbi:MAG: group II intron reverse transcriptase/maturase, partial [Actinobacteria bacterium]|nr:group II intron reverse transcriptase/maturase [Actinomycetota bacterium]